MRYIKLYLEFSNFVRKFSKKIIIFISFSIAYKLNTIFPSKVKVNKYPIVSTFCLKCSVEIKLTVKTHCAKYLRLDYNPQKRICEMKC